MKSSSIKTKCSYIIMGLGQFLYGQRIKGLLYMGILGLYLWYLFTSGIGDMTGFFTLGTVEADPWLGTEGDDSVIMMLRGILSFLILGAVIIFYLANIKDIKETERLAGSGKMLPSFYRSVLAFVDKKFYVVALFFPVIGVLIFNVLPIIFMILIAFTNYGGNIVPPKLIDWIGLDNFRQIFSLSGIKGTFVKILGWNITWAICATLLNYFGGLLLALLLNKRCVKGKAIWRAFPIIAYAVPGFITLLGFKFMFSYGGPINYYIKAMGGTSIGFLDIDAGWRARIIGLLVNAWISIPTSMLLATGILSNMNNELYEAASLDGAGRWKQFTNLTLPFVVFSTTPTLITSFVGNFNNFGVFYFLRGGLYLDDYFLASDTDLLINWLYNLSIDNNYYGIGAAVSLIIFIITSVISLTAYVNSSAFKKEDTFR
ncbi:MULTISPECIES: carbohydrate ABC transporter permease [unclassified Butyrivibrio]|uniref:carbohydrate ABC transporter permease n=1 Tax=unclassified Butyrivibrio TaxID=2639466 RepID=UPI0004193479|nr:MULTISPECIES: sugar ABC transporter permease [unclassified Butyrivibrio]